MPAWGPDQIYDWGRSTLGALQSPTFDEQYLVSDPFTPGIWDDWESRNFRYRFLWSLYENTAYSSVHDWDRELKKTYGIYAWARNIYNPTYRLVEFYAQHLMGGHLDPKAGDGKKSSSCLPVLVENESLRSAVAAVWKSSNWKIRRTVYCRNGAAYGDTALAVRYDQARDRVFLEVVNPHAIRWVDLDDLGHVQGYMLEWLVPDPQAGGGDAPGLPTHCVRSELCTKQSGGKIVYETYKDGERYDWRSLDSGGQSRAMPSVWVAPVDFVPFVLVKHIDVGSDFGWAEIHAGRSKIFEADDVVSCITDQGRRILNAPWACSSKPPANRRTTGGTLSVSDENSGSDLSDPVARDKLKVRFMGDPQMKLQQMIGQMGVGEMSAHAQNIFKALERDYAELVAEGSSLSGDVSGRSLRIAQQKAEKKVVSRRESYDDGMIRAVQMAISVGSALGTSDYSAFDSRSFRRGELDFRIGPRPVFAVDPLDEMEEQQAFWAAAVQATSAGLPLEVFLKRNGWTDQDIIEYNESRDREDKRSQAKSAAMTDRQSRLLAARAGGGTPPRPREDRNAPPNRTNGALTRNDPTGG